MASMLTFAACTGSPPDVELLPPDSSDVGCPLMFHQSAVTEYHVEISDAEWAALEDEFHNVVERTAAGLDPKPYHPIDLRVVIAGESHEPTDVMMRLKGASSWLQAIDLDDDPKMQFVISFNEIDSGGRFLGVRKVELDMPRSDLTFLRHRVALTYLRESGVPAQCANNARLYVNGAYYGLYTNIERLDKEFLQRHYGHDDAEGDLWKSGREIKTNEDTFSWARLEALWDVPDMASFAALADIDAALLEWAAEAMIGDADGYYNGRANFYLYDHPTRGFVWIPHDVDTAMADDYLPPDASPVFPFCAARWERDWHHYILAMNDPATVTQYAAAIADVRSRYDVGAMQERVDLFAGQIAGAAAEDPRRPFTMGDHDWAVSQMYEFIPERADYIDAWLDCRENGGPDEDGDGYDMCNDCNDRDASVHPGAVETCNLRDDNCDGRVDTVDGATVCE